MKTPTVVGVPGHVVKRDNKSVRKMGESLVDLDQVKMPDPVEDAFRRLTIRILELEKKVDELEVKLNHEAL